MSCAVCTYDDAWHRRQMEHLDNEIGPMAAYEFEQRHPEEEEESDIFYDEDEVIARQSLMIASANNPDLAFFPEDFYE